MAQVLSLQFKEFQNQIGKAKAMKYRPCFPNFFWGGQGLYIYFFLFQAGGPNGGRSGGFPDPGFFCEKVLSVFFLFFFFSGFQFFFFFSAERCRRTEKSLRRFFFFSVWGSVPCNLVAQCSATPAIVAATPRCSATPFQTQISVRHLPAHRGGGGATPKFLGGVARHRRYTCKTL